MRIPFVDLHAQYLTIKQEIDGSITEVIAESGYIRRWPTHVRPPLQTLGKDPDVAGGLEKLNGEHLKRGTLTAFLGLQNIWGGSSIGRASRLNVR
jgi:hypothetical protein